MKATLLKNSRSKQVMNRLELSALAEMIRKNPNEKQVYHLRRNLTSADESRSMPVSHIFRYFSQWG